MAGKESGVDPGGCIKVTEAAHSPGLTQRQDGKAGREESYLNSHHSSQQSAGL